MQVEGALHVHLQGRQSKATASGAVVCGGVALELRCACPTSFSTHLTSSSSWSPVPSGPPRKVEVEPLNSTAVHVSWKLPVPSKQHGQIRGYQVTYVRLENGEPRGAPIIQDVMLAEAQVCPREVVGSAGRRGDRRISLPLWSLGSLPSPACSQRAGDTKTSRGIWGSAETRRLGPAARITPSSVLGLPELSQPRLGQPHLPWWQSQPGSHLWLSHRCQQCGALSACPQASSPHP